MRLRNGIDHSLTSVSHVASFWRTGAAEGEYALVSAETETLRAIFHPVGPSLIFHLFTSTGVKSPEDALQTQPTFLAKSIRSCVAVHWP